MNNHKDPKRNYQVSSVSMGVPGRGLVFRVFEGGGVEGGEVERSLSIVVTGDPEWVMGVYIGTMGRSL